MIFFFFFLSEKIVQVLNRSTMKQNKEELQITRYIGMD